MRFADKIPFSVARMSSSIEGETGEGYVAAFDDKLVFFSRKTGEDAFSVSEGGADLVSAKIRKEGFNIFLDTKISDKAYSLRFSSTEESDLAKIADKFLFSDKPEEAVSVEEKVAERRGNINDVRSTHDHSAETKILDLDSPSVEPLVLLAVGMMFIAKSDERITKEEDFFIVSLLNYDKVLLRKALDYFKNSDFDKFMHDLKPLDGAQKLCILANMTEVAMKDASFSGVEQKMLGRFVSELSIDKSDFETIKQVSLIKNNISVLT
jgi:uncharacterized tellurite resistance protein B-like protein